ncbi:glutamate racemase [Costertonia aggregata]|uniref:Glutamate racemase n=1 Tax=Costertonia aggregata TaxID=343403 RepID=A0A7H9AMH5_9FLAO|nr:glutamate racemase [Costertonia aggregata]QLG44485.1 glutamate racemase [Costertonia aggregata]
MNTNPIGIFDSGIGGTSIWREISLLMPNENCMYLADSKNAPYGDKSVEEIVELSIKNTELLLNKGCKIIVVACNTATTNAITYLRDNYNVPFIGIEPAIKPAALQSETKSVGVLATKGTLASSLFHSTTANHSEGITVHIQEGLGLVPLIESGEISSDKTTELLEKFLKPMLEQNIDALVLGCTHYPYLIPILKNIIPSYIKIIDSGLAVAKQTKAILEKKGMISTTTALGKHQFYTNINTTVLESFLQTDASNCAVEYMDF